MERGIKPERLNVFIRIFKEQNIKWTSYVITVPFNPFSRMPANRPRTTNL
jgi:hypothetical protein